MGNKVFYDVQHRNRDGNWRHFSTVSIGRPYTDPFLTEGQAEAALKAFLDQFPLHREEVGKSGNLYKVEFRIVRVTPTKRFAPGGP